MTYTEFKASIVAKTRMDEFVSMIQKKKKKKLYLSATPSKTSNIQNRDFNFQSLIILNEISFRFHY